MSEARKHLILNIDDFGLLNSINEAADRLLQNYPDIGLSLIPNGEVFDEAVSIAKTRNAPVGIHLGLVQEPPVSKPSRVSSLLGQDGFFPKNYWNFIGKYYGGSIKKSELKREIDAQITRVKDTGLPITHLDAHQHIHLLPGIFEILVNRCLKYDINYVRTVNERLVLNRFRPKNISVLAAKFLSYRARRKADALNLFTNDFFVGVHPPAPLDEASLSDLVYSLPEGVTEWGIHVSTEDLSASGRFHSKRRLDENFRLFSSEWFRRELEENDVKVTRHSEVS